MTGIVLDSGKGLQDKPNIYPNLKNVLSLGIRLINETLTRATRGVWVNCCGSSEERKNYF